MARLPVVSATEAVRAFNRAGFLFARQHGSHIILLHQDGRHASVPNHREIDPGTLRSMIRNAGMTVDEFVGLLKS
ncbi:MAG: type II toxin-antitoxin system HicA family toxin [Chloroflexi bacterium]|nr:type II toxin-antitoxin system HicA family toxin [Chloroflexota bacterium]